MGALQCDRVAVVLVHLGNFELTHGCLESLRVATYSLADVIVVDNGSTDGSAVRLASEHPHVKFLHSPVNAGFTGGNNLGMQYALDRGYGYILLLNNDTFVSPGFLEPLVAHLKQHEEVGAVQPLIFFNHDRHLIWNAGSFYNSFWGYTSTRGLHKKVNARYSRPCGVDWITGCAFMIRAEALQKTGLFVPRMFLYYEDVDLSFRLRQKGYRLAFVPQSVIYHIAGASGKKKTKEGTILPQIHYYNLRNRIWLLKAYTPWYLVPSVAVYNGLYMGALMAYFAMRGRWQKLRAAKAAVCDGIGGSIPGISLAVPPAIPVDEVN